MAGAPNPVVDAELAWFPKVNPPTVEEPVDEAVDSGALVEKPVEILGTEAFIVCVLLPATLATPTPAADGNPPWTEV